MQKGQQFKTLFEMIIQGKTFKPNTVFEVFMVANDHEKENHLIAVCGKNGKPKSTNYPQNFTGINQKSVDKALERHLIELL